jgi:two-component system sensor histidine kinase KdpD
MTGWSSGEIVRVHHPRNALISLAAALLAPIGLTALLIAVNLGNPRDYIYLYLGVVAILGVASGVGSAVVAAASSFLLVDYFFVPPFHTFQFAEPTDLVNLCVFSGAAVLVGTLGSRRRDAQLRAEALSQELQIVNAELSRLSETEKQMRVLEETDRLRSEVLANVSHELRTPLASILTITTTILQRLGLSHEVSADLDSMATAARRLNRLVSDILDMNRIEGGIVHLQSTDIDLTDAIEAATTRLHRQNSSRAVISHVSAFLPEVVADWDRLGQILDNLLDNADRASPPGSPIQIDADPITSGEIVVRVIDRGPGVPPSLRDRVFERFVHGGQSSADRANGLGLGLPIVRGLVQAQGGKAWLEDSAPNEGAHFAFSLPAAKLVSDRAHDRA